MFNPVHPLHQPIVSTIDYAYQTYPQSRRPHSYQKTSPICLAFKEAPSRIRHERNRSLRLIFRWNGSQRMQVCRIKLEQYLLHRCRPQPIQLVASQPEQLELQQYNSCRSRYGPMYSRRMLPQWRSDSQKYSSPTPIYLAGDRECS